MILNMRIQAFLWRTLSDKPPDNCEQSIISPPLGILNFCKHDIQPKINIHENKKCIQNNKFSTEINMDGSYMC